MATEVVAKDRVQTAGAILLRIIFAAAPIIAGIDKFTNLLVNWSVYVSPMVAKIVPVTLFLRLVGIVEIIAGIIVAFVPRIGGFIVCGWLLLIILNLLSMGAYLDIALRDLGLAVSALAMSFIYWRCPACSAEKI